MEVLAENYFYQNYNVWEDEKLLTFYPRGIIHSITSQNYGSRRGVSKWQHSGVRNLQNIGRSWREVNLGAHGQLHGLGAHWELWMLKQGGMSNMEALKAATINGANYLGIDEQVGSLKEGKLADLRRVR
ncbi:amidohydrolase family protein [Fulvivirga maritima]|uniref:amidohydrolase family protein n=1 Tax=Fulvivirga maritima TaxID=2904247 RepID=UPI001F1EE1C9|nr:amidohydrolase family protein [Fulvivirga maritima]UII26858.1 amidohydrolase family protein [Fulvivirga maritima]